MSFIFKISVSVANNICAESMTLGELNISDNLELSVVLHGKRKKIKKCSHCKVSSSQFKLKKCSSCEQAYYCDEECQYYHWYEGGHKEKCKNKFVGSTDI
jgi:hypothetical protein